MPFVVTSCAFKIHRASGRSRGKPVLICILACSLAFHAITFELSSYKTKANIHSHALIIPGQSTQGRKALE